MSRRSILLLLPIVALLAISAAAVAQRSRRGYRYQEIDPRQIDRGGTPVWELDERFKDDVFTFVRVRYSSYGYRGRWATDWPDSDINFPFRLHQLTAIEADPYGKILDLTDPAIFDHPFLYLIEPGDMWLEEAEVLALRKYLLNGGFLMVDDFWGEREWATFYENIKRVFPDREPIELPLEHEIFHCVYDLKKKPQVPSIHAWQRGYIAERYDAQEPHYKGIFDDKGRMMAIICHNTDLGDGWEREGEDPDYFKEMAEKWSYPLGINIVVYAMTH